MRGSTPPKLEVWEILRTLDEASLENASPIQHVARDNSGLSLTNSTVQVCHQKAMGSKTMERRVSTVILNVYQSTGIEKEDDSRQSLENYGKLDEIRRFQNKKFEEGHDEHRNLASAEGYSRPNK